MNSNVLLLLLGALCIIGCARAYLIKVEDAKKAIDAGWLLYSTPQATGGTGANFQITLSDGRKVIVGCEYRGNHKTRFDCDLPRGNFLPVKYYKDLNTWFKGKHAGYWVKPPEYKYNSRFANTGRINDKDEKEKNFNFHVEVTDGAYNLLMKLLSRLI